MKKYFVTEIPQKETLKMSKKMSKNDQNLRQLLRFFKKILWSQSSFSILQFTALWCHFIFSIFFTLFFQKVF